MIKSFKKILECLMIQENFHQHLSCYLVKLSVPHESS